MAIETVLPFNKIQLEEKKEDKCFTYNNLTISLRTPSIQELYDIVMVSISKSWEDGFCNPLKLEVYFQLNVVYTFTKIKFTEEDRIDEFELFDKLKNSGLLEKVLAAVQQDLEELWSYLLITVDKLESKSLSVVGLLNSLIEDLPKNAEAAMEIVNNFDPEKFQAVKDFAEAANGGRPIPQLKKD